MSRITAFIGIVLACGILAAVAACDGGSSATSLPQGSEQVSLDPATFANEIDNPYWPLATGSRWRYRETDDSGARRRVDVVVTGKTKRILGIDAVVVHDTVREHGMLVEDTYDWYGQDADGNIWYLGEDTKEYENGKVATTEGSLQAGVDGAQPGVVVPAHPEPGMSYREEYYAGQAEDAARVLAVDQKVEVPYGFFQGGLLTQNVTALEPKVAEQKVYVKGIGPVREMTISGGSDETRLVDFTRGR
jgi:hypothetical protein